MKYFVLPLIVIIVSGIFFAGCTGSSGPKPVTPDGTATALPTPEPATPAVTVPETTAPPQVVTIVHQVSRTKDIKDSELLFALQVPEEWTVSTYRLKNPEGYEGLVFKTDIVEDDVFYIHTYAISRSQDQAYRDQFRQWSPAPAETTVTMNDITYDRFETVSGGKTHVAYVVKKGSANERGYASVLVFSADNNNRFERDDFEKIAASFRYFSTSAAGTVPGEEIPRTNG